MGKSGMNVHGLGKTKLGGEQMEQQEITLGHVTYQVSRVYTGNCHASDLIAERLTKQLSENPPFDEGHTKVV